MKDLSLETILTTSAGFDLPASPLQRAIARAADGQTVPVSLLPSTDVERYFGCKRGALGRVKPSIVAIVAGVRGGKSLLAAAAAVRGALTVDLSKLRKHEVPRFSIVGPVVDNADATFQLLKGSVEAAPPLAAMIEGTPTADTIVLRRPDGHRVEIVVVAASRGAVTLRSRWSVGFVLDECALFGSEPTGAVVNVEELARAGETRLVPGAQGWMISSPFGPSGLLYDTWSAHFGKPGRTLVVHAPTHAMNPAFPIEQIEELRRTKPDVAAREYDAEWTDADSAFLDGANIDRAVRQAPLEEAPRAAGYSAAMDAATRGNAWTLVIARAELAAKDVTRIVVACARQWQGSKKEPLDPDLVLREIAAICKRYDIAKVACDEWGVDALRSIAKGYGLRLQSRSMSTGDAYDAYDAVRTLLATDRLELPPVPLLVQDLKGLRKRASANAIRIELPKTSDGRHADFAPALALACAAAPTAARRGSGSGGATGGCFGRAVTADDLTIDGISGDPRGYGYGGPFGAINDIGARLAMRALNH